MTAIGTGGAPEAQEDAPAAPSHSFLDLSPFPDGAPEYYEEFLTRIMAGVVRSP